MMNTKVCLAFQNWFLFIFFFYSLLVNVLHLDIGQQNKTKMGVSVLKGELICTQIVGQSSYRVSLKELHSDDFDFFATRKCKSDQGINL